VKLADTMRRQLMQLENFPESKLGVAVKIPDGFIKVNKDVIVFFIIHHGKNIKMENNS